MRDIKNMTSRDLWRLTFADCAVNEAVGLSDVFTKEEIIEIYNTPHFDRLWHDWASHTIANWE